MPPRFKQLIEDPFLNTESGPIERKALRASLDFHPTVCQAFFGTHTVLVEGDSEIAVLQGSNELLDLCEVTRSTANQVSVISCGGKWTIPAIARLLKNFGLPVRVIHDLDARKRSVEELAKCKPIDPYKANEVIASILEPHEIFICEDAFEHLLWNKKFPKSDKPFSCWRRVKKISKSKESLALFPRVREFVRFAYLPAEITKPHEIEQQDELGT